MTPLEAALTHHSVSQRLLYFLPSTYQNLQSCYLWLYFLVTLSTCCTRWWVSCGKEPCPFWSLLTAQILALCLSHKRVLGFPGGAVVGNLPANAGDTGSSPSGRIPHAAEQLGPWATIAEPAHLEPVLRNKRGRDSERPAHCDEEWPPLATTRESPRTETKTQHSHK